MADLSNIWRGFVSFISGANTVYGEKDAEGNVHAIVDLGQGARAEIGLINKSTPTVSYTTPGGKLVTLFKLH